MRRRRLKTNWTATAEGYTSNSTPMSAGDQLAIPLLYPQEAQLTAYGEAADWDNTTGLVVRHKWGQPIAEVTALRVVGQMLFEPSTWALGNTFRLGLRCGVYEYDEFDLGAVVRTGYRVAEYDDATESFLWQHFLHRNFSSGESNMWTVDVDIRVKRRIEQNKNLFMMVDIPTNGVGIRFWSYLRTLVKVGRA